MPANLLSLVLLAGYWFNHTCHSFKYRARMLDGFRLLIECSLAGVCLLLLSRMLIYLAKGLSLYGVLKGYWGQLTDVPYLGTFLLCLPLSALVAAIWNCFVNGDEERDLAVQNLGDSLAVLMQDAFNGDRILSITLESRKWYVGYIVGEQTLKPNEKYFRLLPVLSGYRDKDTLEAHRSVEYATLYEDGTVDVEDFVITLPLQSVRSANFFDPDVYQDRFQDATDPNADSAKMVTVSAS